MYTFQPSLAYERTRKLGRQWAKATDSPWIGGGGGVSGEDSFSEIGEKNPIPEKSFTFSLVPLGKCGNGTKAFLFP